MTVDASVHYRKIGGVIAPRVAALQSSVLRNESGAVHADITALLVQGVEDEGGVSGAL